MLIPETTHIKARPVWLRHRRRAFSNINQLPPPTTEEVRDAILVIADPDNAYIHGLWDEASRIFLEASR